MEHLEGLAKELTCSICLSVMEPPVARLPCCHYFCLECVSQSVRHRPQCPVCKAKVGRRDVSRDETMDRVVTAFAGLQAHREELLAQVALRDETQNYSQPPLEPSQPAAAGAVGAAAALLGEAAAAEDSPAPAAPAAAAALLAAVEAPVPASPPASLAGGGAERGEQVQQEQQGQQAQRQEEGQPGKRTPEGEPMAGSCAKRARHAEQAQQEGADAEQLGTGRLPLAFVRGVDDGEFQSPSGSVTSSAIDNLRWRGPLQGRRLSLPSAHPSPAKQAQQDAAGPAAGAAAEQEQLKENCQPEAEQPEQAQQQPEQAQQEAAGPSQPSQMDGTAAAFDRVCAAVGAGAGAGASNPTSAGAGWKKRKSGRQQPDFGIQDIAKWVGKKASPRQRAQQAAAVVDAPAAEDEQAQQAHALDASPSEQQQQQQHAQHVEEGSAANDQQAAAAAAAVCAPAVASPAHSLAADAAAGTDAPAGGAGAAAEEAAGASPPLFSPEALSPGRLRGRLNSIVQGLDVEAGLLSPAPTQPAAFQSSKVPWPSAPVPPPPRVAVAAAAVSGPSGGGGPLAAGAAPDRVAAAVLAAAASGEDRAAHGEGAVTAGPPAERQEAAAAAEPEEQPAARQQAEQRQQAKPCGKERRSTGRPPRGKAAAGTTAAATAAAAFAVLSGNQGTPSARTPAAGLVAAAALAPGTAGEAGSSWRRVPSRLVQWGCSACTFLNEPQRRKCQMCSTPKPPASRAAPGQQQQQQQQPEGGAEPGPQPPPAGEATPAVAGRRGAAAEGAGRGSSAKRARLSMPGTGAAAGPSRASSQRGGASGCAFCGQQAAGEECGELVAVELAGGGHGLVHEGCAKWAPNVYEDDSAPHGLANVASEVARARTLHCAGCGRAGAALGCAVKSCRSTYHLPCALEADGTAFDQASWALCCPQHASRLRGSGARRRRGSSAAAGGAAVGAAEDDNGEEDIGEEGEEESVEEEQGPGEAAAAAGQGGAKRRSTSAPGGARREGSAPASSGPAPDGALAAPAASEEGSAGRLQRSTARTAGAAAPWQGPQHTGWVLLGSGLDAKGKEQLARLAAAAGGSVTSRWSDSVTHVVCGLVDGAARRTFKYLMGLLAGRWVVGQAWLEAYLQEGRPADEEAYEVARDTNGCEGGPAASRRSAALGLPKLLAGYQLFLAGDWGSKAEVAELLGAAGARTLARMPSTPASADTSAAGGPITTFVLCEQPEAGSPAERGGGRRSSTSGGAAAAATERAESAAGGEALRQAKWYKRAVEAGVPVVSSRWLMDSVGACTLRPLGPYVL